MSMKHIGTKILAGVLVVLRAGAGGSVRRVASVRVSA